MFSIVKQGAGGVKPFKFQQKAGQMFLAKRKLFEKKCACERSIQK